MHAPPEIIELLNDVLTAELTAVNQYFGHAKMQANWGYLRLAEHAQNESMDEMRHADELIERILYLEGMPNLQRLGSVRLGEDPVEQLRLDLELEREAVARFNRGIALSPRAARSLITASSPSSRRYCSKASADN
jgi:bacterioferritin